jgi:hypothetical protein
MSDENMQPVETRELVPLGETPELTHSSEGMFCDAQDGPERDELTGSWRTWRNEGLHNLCSSPNMINDDQIKEDEMGGVCSTHEEIKHTSWFENLKEHRL